MLEQFDALPVPFYTTLGNHDLMGAAWERFTEVIGPTNVAFDVRGVRIVLADTANALFAPGAYSWLERSLARESGPALVFTHIPPFEPWGGRNHAFSNRDEAMRFVQTLSEGEATHFFAGHIHSYADYQMRGVPSTIAGGGGGGMEALTVDGHFYTKLVVDPFATTGQVTLERVGLD
ncbi:MAG: metallophosphoesterase [Myxococcales bacterium]